MKNIMISIALLFVVVGCSSLNSVAIHHSDAEHVVKNAKYMSCDIDYFQHSFDGSGSVYGPKYESVANKSFVYALMSANAYTTLPQFDIPEWKRIRRYQSDHDFTADIWLNSVKKQLVIAYRNVDLNRIDDWTQDKLNLFFKGQHQDVVMLTRKIAREFPDYGMVATGHALAGELAMYSSVYRAGVDAIVFDSAPRIYREKDYPDNTNYRLLVSESDAAMAALQDRLSPLKAVKYDGPYNRFNFVYDDAEVQHGVYYLARGLTAVAASTGNMTAVEVMQKNLGCKLEK